MNVEEVDQSHSRAVNSIKASLLAGRCQAEAGRNGLRPLLVKSRFMRMERTQNSHWSEVPHELISCKYLTRTTFRNVILKLAFNQWRIKP